MSNETGGKERVDSASEQTPGTASAKEKKDYSASTHVATWLTVAIRIVVGAFAIAGFLVLVAQYRKAADSTAESTKQAAADRANEIKELLDKARDELGGEEGTGRLTLPRRVTEPQLERARRFLDKARSLGPRDPEVAGGFCIWQHAAGNYREAERECRERLRIDPTSAAAHVSLAGVLLAQKKNGEALDHSQQAVACAPRDAAIRSVLSCALMVLKRHDEALAEAQKAVELNKDSAPVQGQRADVLIAMKRYGEAEVAERMVIRLDPKSARDWGQLGLTLAAQARVKEAIGAFAVAVGIDSRPPPYTVTIFSMLIAMSREDPEKLDEAGATLKAATADSRTAFYAREAYCYFLSANKRSLEAIRECRKVIAVSPTPYALAALGLALSDVGRVKEAIAMLEQGLAADTEAHPSRAKIEEVLGCLREGKSGCSDIR